LFALAIGRSLFRQFIAQGGACESGPQGTSVAGRTHSNMIVMAPEADFVAGLDTEFVT
jgi:hypothetical protein